MTASHDDEKMAQLLDRHGPEGYGMYWLLWEHVAASIQKGKDPSATYSLSEWSRRLHSHPNRVSKYLVALGSREGSGGGMGGCRLIVAETLQDGRIRVEIPNILKYRDEYQRKSGHSPDTLRTVNTETETETETDTHPKPHPPDGGSVCAPVPTNEPVQDRPDDATPLQLGVNPNPPLNGHQSCPEGRVYAVQSKKGLKVIETDPIDEWFERVFWPAYPRKACKTAAKKAAQRKMITQERRERAMQHLASDVPEWLARPPDKRPHAATWFNQDRWDDPIEPDPLPLLPPDQSERYKFITPLALQPIQPGEGPVDPLTVEELRGLRKKALG